MASRTTSKEENIINLEPQQPVLNGCLVKTPTFNIHTWNHPVENTHLKLVVESSKYKSQKMKKLNTPGG